MHTTLNPFRTEVLCEILHFKCFDFRNALSRISSQAWKRKVLRNICGAIRKEALGELDQTRISKTASCKKA